MTSGPWGLDSRIAPRSDQKFLSVGDMRIHSIFAALICFAGWHLFRARCIVSCPLSFSLHVIFFYFSYTVYVASLCIAALCGHAGCLHELYMDSFDFGRKLPDRGTREHLACSSFRFSRFESASYCLEYLYGLGVERDSIKIKSVTCTFEF